MPASQSRSRNHALAYTALTLLFVVSVATFGQRAYDTIDLALHDREYVRPPFYLGDANWGIVLVLPEAEAAGMKFADELLSVNGHPIDGFIDYYGLVCVRESRVIGCACRCDSPARLRAPYVISRSSCARIAAVLTRPPASSITSARFLRAIVLPAVCIALGFWVAAVRIGHRPAWLLLALLLSLPATYGGGGPTESLFGRASVWQPLLTGFGVFCAQLAAPALMLFGIAFPDRLPLDRRFPWFKWIVAGYLVLVAASASVAVGLWIRHLALARRTTQPLLGLLTGVEGDFGSAVVFLALVVCAASLGWKAMTAPTRDARRRVLLLFVGAAPGVAALLVMLIAGRLEYILPPWTLLPLTLMLLVFPLTMAYVILVHRAMDVGVVIRQGLQYVLATHGVTALQIA